MNREYLKGLGVDEENIDKIMAEHGKTVTKVKDDLSSAQSDLETVRGQLAERDSQLDELSKKAKGNDELTAEIERLKDENAQQLEAYKADALNAKKNALLAKAGYTDEQITLLRGTVAGETDEELAQSIEGLKAVIEPKPTYVDPSPMNGERGKPEQVSAEEKGRDLFKRLRGKQ